MLPAGQFESVYAPETQQNHKGVPGRLRFVLARGAEARAIAAHATAIEIAASDTAGNQTVVEWLDV
jgi:hypothetical protein